MLDHLINKHMRIILQRLTCIYLHISIFYFLKSSHSKLEQDVFEPQTVMNYAEIFHHGRDYGQIMPASMKSYSFIIDSQRRFNSRYGWKIGGVPIVSDTQVIAKYVP